MTNGFDDFERAGWSGRAGAYEMGYAEITAPVVESLLDAAEVRQGVVVLDIGTGTGNVAAAACARGALVTAVDPDPGMLARAARRAPDATMMAAALPTLPLAGATFDAVVANFAINHTGDPPAAVRELLRVLRPGGWLALSAWRYPQMRANAIVTEAFERAGATRPDWLPSVTPWRRHSDPLAFASLLVTAGCTCVEIVSLEWDHVIEADRWWHHIVEGTPMDAALLAAQDAPTVRRVRAAYDDLVRRHVRDDGLAALPASAHVARGRRPGS